MPTDATPPKPAPPAIVRPAGTERPSEAEVSKALDVLRRAGLLTKPKDGRPFETYQPGPEGPGYRSKAQRRAEDKAAAAAKPTPSSGEP